MFLFSRVLFLASLVFFIFSNGVAEDPKADPRANLDTAITEYTRLLEAKEYGKFLKAAAPEGAIEGALKGKSFDDFAKWFGEKKADQVLRTFKQIKDQKPKLEKEGAQATFEWKEGDAPARRIQFMKVKGIWYLMN